MKIEVATAKSTRHKGENKFGFVSIPV